MSRLAAAAVLAFLAAVGAAQPLSADSGVTLGATTVTPASVKAGGAVQADVALKNGTEDDLPGNLYQVQVELLSSSGEMIQKTSPIAVRAPILAGHSKNLHIKGIVVPPALTGRCSLRVSVLAGDSLIRSGAPAAFTVEPAGPGMELGRATVEPDRARPGGEVRTNVRLSNASANAWPAGLYQVQVELFSPAGESVQKTAAIPVNVPVLPGQSKTLHINGIRLPPTLSGQYSARVLVLSGETLVSAGEPALFAVEPAGPVAALSRTAVEPDPVESGGSVSAAARLTKSSSGDWAAGAYQIQVEILSSSGAVALTTPPVPAGSALAAGRTQLVHVDDIQLPPELSGRCALRFRVLSGETLVLAGEPKAFTIAPAAVAVEPARPGAELSRAAVEPDSVEPGASVAASATLTNSSSADWAKGAYQIQVEVLSSSGAVALTTPPVPVRAAIAAGKTQVVRIDDIHLPPELSGRCALRLRVLSGETLVQTGEPGDFNVAAPAPRVAVSSAPSAPVQGAFLDFKKTFHSPAFGSPRLVPQDRLVLPATQIYTSTSAPHQAAFAGKALLAWQSSLNAAGAPANAPVATVLTASGGEVWRLSGGSAEQADTWSDDRRTYGPPKNPNGSFFGFIGGQAMTGGAANVTGVNARLGTTLLDNRYDAAVTYAYNSLDTSPKITSTSYGLVGRALFHVDPRWGWNLGVEGLHNNSNATGNTKTFDVLGGVSFNVPGGSLDLTLGLGSGGSTSFLFGYTFYVSRP